ncbi:hypothetical protein GCM10023116_37490 [Kistimonas scapharcae]|uniref:Uncharacterized protein n=1 Tax=Kistimonas scapharcae TaxID=1036133 RepID=A0ABP8V5Z4_9GAMM
MENKHLNDQTDARDQTKTYTSFSAAQIKHQQQKKKLQNKHFNPQYSLEKEKAGLEKTPQMLVPNRLAKRIIMRGYD